MPRTRMLMAAEVFRVSRAGRPDTVGKEASCTARFSLRSTCTARPCSHRTVVTQLTAPGVGRACSEY